MYIGTVTGCKKVRDISAKHGSKEDPAKLHAVAKAPKASPMKALRNFQRQQFGRPPMLLGVHYHRTLKYLGYNNSSIDQLTQLKQEYLYIEINREDYSGHEVEIQN